MRLLTLLTATAVSMTCSAAASAADYFYSLTRTTGAGFSASWQLPSMPTPDTSNAGQGFSLTNVSGTFSGATGQTADFDFFSQDNDGGFSIFDGNTSTLLRSFYGAQIYSGDEAAPTMLLGTFDLSGDDDANYTLQVTDGVSGAVPEPATWAMMILGFAAVGGAMRTRRTTVRYA